jgi:cobalamin biosynthetic protein CobC
MAFSGDPDETLLHGGDLAAARRLFADAPEPFVDLSTGINPHSYPLPRLPADLFVRLPDDDLLAEARAAAAKAYGAPSSAHVVAAPGTQILLPLVAALVRPGRAAILTPTYSEHARATSFAGHQVAEIADLGAFDTVPEATLVIVTNPNNPDGRLFDKRDLMAVARRLEERRGLLVVDEAFMDVGPPAMSLASEVSGSPIVVLRSFGKFFGLAGVRLGFALARPQLARRIAARLGPWAVSGPALAVGGKALADFAWTDDARRRLVASAARLDAILAGAGVHIIGGTTLFRLVRTRTAPKLFQHLGHAGILVRAFPEHPSWLRFGLPADEAEWNRLKIAMADCADTQ